MHRPHLAFALALHERLAVTGNMAWSPYSVAAAMGLAAAGARGRTHDELAAALAPGGDLGELGAMLTRSAQLEHADIAVANTLWMRLGLPFQDDFARMVLGLPGGAASTADFAGDPDGARSRINDDVERTTRGLIRELLARGVITPQTSAVIVNALYLKVAWRTSFAEAATGPAAFHAASGTRQVPTMRQQARVGYATAHGWRMVTLPTVSDVVVDVLLPVAGDAAVSAAAVSAATVVALQESSRPTMVDLAMPRFRIEMQTSLDAPLQRLGVLTAFTRDADFSAVTEAERIWIDTVVHKAVLRLDETGFEGAAATAVVMRLTSFDPTAPVPFHVDRPFLVLVRHAQTGAIYFLARVSEP